MAELNSSIRTPGARSVKPLPRVDLTAMVDLAFLLITFFMLTTTLAKHRAMELAMPVDGPPMPVSDNRTMTICIGKDNKLQWYRGTLDHPIVAPVADHYNRTGIGRALLQQSKAVIKDTSNPDKDLIVLIKPSDKSSYKNLVDLLDELKIAAVRTYAIVDITQKELDIMKVNRIY